MRTETDLIDIPNYENYIKIEPLNKGWSADKKYIIETADGEKQLLRIADIAEHDRKKAEYGMVERAYNHGIPTPKPIEFGLCNDGQNVYSLFGWFEGEERRLYYRICQNQNNTIWA